MEKVKAEVKMEQDQKNENNLCVCQLKERKNQAALQLLERLLLFFFSLKLYPPVLSCNEENEVHSRKEMLDSTELEQNNLKPVTRILFIKLPIRNAHQ